MKRLINSKHLYIHIPFCNHICSYCAFNKSIFNEKFAVNYIDTLLEELNLYELSNLKTIYIGGGTPTSLSCELLEKLLKEVSKYLDKDYEFSVEVNPETMNDEKIDILKKYGVNRISIGVQSFDKDILKYLNRYHDEVMVRDLINKLHLKGFNNISLDLIYGIKGQTKAIIKHDLETFISLGVTHISTYLLQIEEHTALFNKHEETLSDDEVVDQYNYICSLLKDFNHYEISNFAKVGYESRHNLCYWTNKDYLGLGISSSSYIDGVRYKNTDSLTKYLKKDFSRYEEQVIKGNEYEFEYIMLHLRLNSGLSLKEYKDIFNKDFLEAYKNELKDLKKFLIINDRVIIKEEYFLQQNDILSSLLLNLDY